MKARLSRNEWATEFVPCSILLNFHHMPDPPFEAIGLMISVESLPAPMRLGGQLDIQLSYKEAQGIIARLQRIMREMEPQGSTQTKGENQ